MIKKIIILFCLCPLFGWAKDYQLKIRVKNLPDNPRPLLLRIYNGNLLVLDSLPMIYQDEITFNIPETTPPGMLRSVLGMTPYTHMAPPRPIALDILFNQEYIEINTDYTNPQNTVEVVQSEENKLYYEFLRSDLLFFNKLGLLEQVVQNYPEKDDFYSKALAHYLKVQNERDKFIDKICKTNPHLLSARIIKNQKMPALPGKVTAKQRDSIVNAQFLSKVDFNDTTLLYTNTYTDKVFRFIQMHLKQNATPRENEANCIHALDRLIPYLEVNPVIQQHLLQFLIEGFENMKMEEVLAHISANYLQQCGSNAETIKRRLEGYSKMAIGKKVPDFTLNDIQGHPYNLYNTISPYTLILFWHTECGHCQQLLKELPALSQKDFFRKHQIQLIGISIDTNKEEWEKFSATYPLTWINTYAEGGYDSTIASDYNLFATPTMFLVDSDYNIISKPLTLEELINNINQLK